MSNCLTFPCYLPRTDLLLCAVATNRNVTANSISMSVEFHRKINGENFVFIKDFRLCSAVISKSTTLAFIELLLIQLSISRAIFVLVFF